MTEEEKKDLLAAWAANRDALDEAIDAICYAARYNDFDEIDAQVLKIRRMIKAGKVAL